MNGTSPKNTDNKEINKIMNNEHDNGNYDLFKYQLEDEQKILIFHILKDFPQEIKDKICEAIDLAIDKSLSEIDYNFYDNEWHNNEDYDFYLENNEWYNNGS